MANVYLSVTDRHDWPINIIGRYNYPAEIAHADRELLKVIKKYKEQGHKVYLNLMGDLYHQSYNDIFDAVAANNFIIMLRTSVDGIFGMIGNHEWTYYRDNPFWTLVTDIKSPRIQAVKNRVWQPKGRFPVIDIVDEYVDGDVRFIYNHYGVPITRPEIDGKTNVGLFHVDLYAKQIVEDMERKLDLDIFEHTPVYFDGSGVLRGYDYAHLGHMHMLYGRYKYKDDETGFLTNLQYLSTTGRTNHLEVNDNFLERNYPAIIVENGVFIREEQNTFNLMTRSECVNEEIILKAQETRAVIKEKKQFSDEYTSPASDDPIHNLRTSLTGNAAYLAVFEDLVGKGTTGFEKSLDELYEEVFTHERK